jgi:hypothetical protein
VACRCDPVSLRVRYPGAILMALFCGLVVCACSQGSTHRHRAHKARAATQQRPFAPDSPWNQPLTADAPQALDSTVLVTELVADVTRFHPWISTTSYSTPVYRVGPRRATVDVVQDTTTWRHNPAFTGVPLPANAKPADGTDASLVVWQPSTDTYWEFWRLHRVGDSWHASWGGRIDHASTSSGVFPAPYGTSASGMALLGGLIRPGEIAAGHIDHALAIGVPNTAPTFVAPAVRTDGKTLGGIPIGTRFRLDPSLDVATLHLPRVAAIIARAAQRYGIYVRDTSGAVPFYAEDPADRRNPWPALFRNLSPTVILASFPWRRLQVVAP